MENALHWNVHKYTTHDTHSRQFLCGLFVLYNQEHNQFLLRDKVTSLMVSKPPAITTCSSAIDLRRRIVIGLTHTYTYCSVVFKWLDSAKESLDLEYLNKFAFIDIIISIQKLFTTVSIGCAFH